MSSQTLITGATGFIGRRLTRDIMTRGDRVRILARNPAKAYELFGDHVEVVAGDICDVNAVEKACRDVDTIYHIAGSYRFGLRHRRELWAANVDGAENLLSSAMAAGVDKVVHLSSGGVLRKTAQRGDGESSHTLIDEKDFPNEAPRFCSYKASKWHSEKRVFSWVRKGLPVAIASTTCPIGEGDETPTPTGQMIHDFLHRRFPFYCRTGLNFLGVGDLSRGLQHVAERGESGQRYLLSGENLWLKEFLDLLSQQTGLPAPRMCLPNALIRLIGYGGEAFDFLNPRSTSARVCVETSLQAERVQFFNNARARHELGWKPVCTIQENIAEAVAWFCQETDVVPRPVVTSSVGSHVQ